jgi:NTE family protein
VGLVVSRESELTGGVQFGRVEANVRAGAPDLPELGGAESVVRLRFAHDGQDSPIVPSRGSRAIVQFTHFLDSPIVEGVERTNHGVSQLEGGVTHYWRWHRRNRLFVMGFGGTSFDDHPISQFTLGYPFRLDAFRIGERRGDHYGVLTVGAARQVGRLPDFMGGPIFAATWLENGSAFYTDEDADFNTHAAVGVIMDTLVGPVVLGSSVGLDGGFRWFVGIGRLVR